MGKRPLISVREAFPYNLDWEVIDNFTVLLPILVLVNFVLNALFPTVWDLTELLTVWCQVNEWSLLFITVRQRLALRPYKAMERCLSIPAIFLVCYFLAGQWDLRWRLFLHVNGLFVSLLSTLLIGFSAIINLLSTRSHGSVILYYLAPSQRNVTLSCLVAQFGVLFVIGEVVGISSKIDDLWSFSISSNVHVTFHSFLSASMFISVIFTIWGRIGAPVKLSAYWLDRWLKYTEFWLCLIVSQLLCHELLVPTHDVFLKVLQMLITPSSLDNFLPVIHALASTFRIFLVSTIWKYGHNNVTAEKDYNEGSKSSKTGNAAPKKNSEDWPNSVGENGDVDFGGIRFTNTLGQF